MSEGGPVRIHARHGSVRGIPVVTFWLQNTSRGSENQQNPCTLVPTDFQLREKMKFKFHFRFSFSLRLKKRILIFFFVFRFRMEFRKRITSRVPFFFFL